MTAGELEIGDEIPPLELTLSGAEVRRYAEAAGMPGARFVSDESARAEGLPGQIFPGNLSAALLARMVLDWLPGARLEKLGVTFRGFVRPDRPLRLSGFVTERHTRPEGATLECDLVLESDGERRVTGIAVLALGSSHS